MLPQHKLIIGDNYDALSNLLVTHKNRIDIIYIDPPYNTGGSNLGYFDKFSKTAWLNFMKERMLLAKQLLADDGVIFVSLDDNMQAYFKVMMDEIFGEENFVTNCPRVTVKGGKTQTNLLTSNYDNLIIYSKNKNLIFFNRLNVSDPAFNQKDNYFEDRGFFHTKQTLDSNSLGYIKSLDFPIYFDNNIYYPGGKELYDKRQKNDFLNGNNWRWTWSENLVKFAINNNFLISKNNRLWAKKYLKSKIEKGKNNEYLITYENRNMPYSNLEFLKNEYSNSNAKRDLDFLGLQGKFSTPKPVDLVMQIIKFIDKKSAIILDFFAGSGTTGHAVLELNKEDNGQRKFILCTKEFDNNNNIAIDVCYERLYRINNGVSTNHQNDFEWAKKHDPYNNPLNVYWLKNLDISVSKENFDSTLNKINLSTYNELNPNLNLNNQNIFIKLYQLFNHLGNKNHD